MLAIHNSEIKIKALDSVANAFAKLSKCQQFTTAFWDSCSFIPLQTLLQSYQNVSNSQQLALWGCWGWSCKRFCKVIKMLAIHNWLTKTQEFTKVANAFAKLSKCQQFTTAIMYIQFMLMLQTLLQSYQNVSNSQLHPLDYLFKYRCKRFCKVIKMLAIHNRVVTVQFILHVANAFAKLSKCQQFTTM